MSATITTAVNTQSQAPSFSTNDRTLTGAQRAILRKGWSSALAEAKKGGEPLTCLQHIIYATLCDRDWRRGITPCTNRRKLQNGRQPLFGLILASGELYWLKRLLATKSGTGLAASLSERESLQPFIAIGPEALLEPLRALCALDLAAAFTAAPIQIKGGGN